MNSVIPLIFRPTATLLIDDDEFFIDNVKKLLPLELNPQLIDRNKFDNLYNNRMFYASGTEINGSYLSSIKSLISFFDTTSELPVSVIVIDQFMSPKNGLDILTQVKSPFVQKILISNLLSDKDALQALNEGLIDFYLCKMEPDFIQNLTHAIQEAQNRFFREISFVMPNFLSDDNPLTQENTVEIFDYIKNQLGMKYYESHSGLRKFRFTNADGTKTINLQIMPENELNEILNSQQAESLSPEIFGLIQAGKILPCFDGNFPPDGENWGDYLQPAQSFQSKQKFLYSIYNGSKNDIQKSI